LFFAVLCFAFTNSLKNIIEILWSYMIIQSVQYAKKYFTDYQD
jgi:hypothetical protein